MKNMKKVLLALMISFVLVGLVGCNSNAKGDSDSKEDIKLTLEEITEKLYEGIKEDELPNMLMNTPLDEENIEYFIGTNEIKYEEAIANESGISAVAHSVVLIKTSSETDIEDAKKLIKESVDPRKWICVEAEEVIVDSKGDVIILIMSSKDVAEKIHNNFLEIN